MDLSFLVSLAAGMTYRLTLISWDSHGDPRATEVSEVLVERVSEIAVKLSGYRRSQQQQQWHCLCYVGMNR